MLDLVLYPIPKGCLNGGEEGTFHFNRSYYSNSSMACIIRVLIMLNK
jgi:hypothetical protein